MTMKVDLTPHLLADRIGVVELRGGKPVIGEITRADDGRWLVTFGAGVVGKRVCLVQFEEAALEARALILGQRRP